MKITEDVRKYAAEQGIEAEQAIATGLASKANEFKQSGESLYAASVAEVRADSAPASDDTVAADAVAANSVARQVG
jgi:hypothetical protein